MPVCVQEKRARRVNSARLFILLDFDCEGVSHDAGSNMLARERMQVGFVSQHHFTAGCAKPPTFDLSVKTWENAYYSCIHTCPGTLVRWC